MTENTNATLADAVVNAVETNDKPTETAAPTVETNDKPKAKRTRKASKPKAKRKAADKGEGDEKPARVPTERDAFGNRLGTSSAAINATIIAARGPLKCREIHERTGAEGRATVGATYRHLSWLLERGHVKMKDGGFVRNIKAKKRNKAADVTSEGADETAGE